MMEPRFLILSGDGINCEKETSLAFDRANARSEIVHINDLLASPEKLRTYQSMAIPGGFSFGDELGSGQVLALKIKHGLNQEFLAFLEKERPLIGICNGFQVLIKLGILPHPKKERSMALAGNKQGTFIDTWVNLEIPRNHICKWLTLLPEEISLPIRHGEGRIILKKELMQSNFIEELFHKGQIPLLYKKDVNGSLSRIAGICDPTGLIFGLMPHPEAFVSESTAPEPGNDRMKKATGQLVFESIVQYLNQ